MAADPKMAKTRDHANAAFEASSRMILALDKGELPAFEDAKILEAAGSYVRKLIAARAQA